MGDSYKETNLTDANDDLSLPDLSNHLSTEARTTLPNPMKVIWRKFLERNSNNNVISLANGDPHYSLFPFKAVIFEVPSVTEEAPDPVPLWRQGKGESTTFTSYKDEYQACSLTLKDALQYTTGAGLPATQEALTRLTNIFHAPPAKHFVSLTLGNADGITKAFRLLGDREDFFFTEEFSFPGMTNAPLGQGIRWVPVRMDAGGLIPEDMEQILENWDDQRGRRPHVLYIVPCGQNPTGSTLNLERRKKIYEISQRWDLVIIEDDPYYFLQYDLPTSGETDSQDQDMVKNFASRFIPSFLSMDVDGRVIRIDSFSKILAPGMRLGWITTNELFYAKLVDYTDSGPQHPHGFGQCFVTEMLSSRGWGTEGFVRWVESLCKDYKNRRDGLVEVFNREVGKNASAAIPQAGMFLWVEIPLHLHPRFHTKQVVGGADTPELNLTNMPVLMDELFNKFMDENLIVMPGNIFATPGNPWKNGEDYVPIADRSNFFRLTFAGTEENIENGVKIFGRVLRDFFQN